MVIKPEDIRDQRLINALNEIIDKVNEVITEGEIDVEPITLIEAE